MTTAVTRSPDRVAAVNDVLRQAGLTAKTVEHYQLYMARAETWCMERGTSLLEASAEEVAGFVASQAASRGSQRVIRCALAYYWRTWGREDPPLHAVVEPSPLPTALRATLDDEEVGLLTPVLQRGDRPAAAASLALLLGLNGVQISHLRWDDLRSDGTVEIRDAAGRGAVMVVHPALAEVLRGLRQNSPWVFPSHSAAGHVRAETVYAWLRLVALEAGLDGVRADAFRRCPVSAGQSSALVENAARVASKDRRRRPTPTTPEYLKRMELYRLALRRAGLAPRTVSNYTGVIARAEEWCEEQGHSLMQISGDELQPYIALLPHSHETLKGLRSALLRYWRLHRHPDPPLWVIRVPRKPLMICRALDDDDAKRLAEAANEVGGPMGAAVTLGLYQALRVSEIARVRWDDFGEDGWMSVMGKGDQPASLPVHPSVLTALTKLPRSYEWVFPGRKRGGPICAATVWSWVRHVAEQAGVANVTPHRLRHTALASANDATGDLRSVQAFARHRDPSVTAGYTKASGQRLTAAVYAIQY